ncbi:MAG: serine hydrolase domain-containing protein [Mariniphaga sp.]
MHKFRIYKLILGLLVFLLLPSDHSVFSNRNILLNSQIESFNRLIINKLIEDQNSVFIDASIEKFMSQNGLKGISVAIVKNEKLIFVKGYGFANEEAQIPVTPNNLFRIASVSKLITAVAVMKLVENSKISLDSKVFGKYGILNDEQFLHIKDKRLEKITVRHLLNHSAGWTQHYGDLAFLPKSVAKGTGESLPVNIDSYIRFVTTHRVHFEPGTNSVYSNLGYVILGKVIAKVAGTDYETFVKTEVLKPAGITDMQLGKSFLEEAFPAEVRYYQPSDGELVESFDGSGRMESKIYGGNDIHLLGSAGGWLASAIDLLKLLVVIDNNPSVKDILSVESINEMTRVDPKGLDPLGWRRTNEVGEWWRTGTLPGSSALVKRLPNGISWVILSNTSNYKGPKLAFEMDRIMSRILLKVDNWPDYNLFSFVNN